jgi:hypothetical protein
MSTALIGSRQESKSGTRLPQISRRDRQPVLVARGKETRDQHGCNQREAFTSQCNSRLPLGTKLHRHAASRQPPAGRYNRTKATSNGQWRRSGVAELAGRRSSGQGRHSIRGPPEAQGPKAGPTGGTAGQRVTPLSDGWCVR